MDKGNRIYKSILLIIITAMITAIITSVLVYNYTINKDTVVSISDKTNEDAVNELEAKLSKFRSIIDKYYLGEVNEDDLVTGAIKGYINGLGDEYSQYYTAEEMKSFEEETSGNFVGIGVYLMNDKDTNTIKVINPIADSPAFKAGIQPGDIIAKVNGEEYKGDQLEVAVSKIKGEEGTNVEIEILRGTETINLNITRENIKVNHVESRVLENNIGYLAFQTFDENCSQEFIEKYEELNKNNTLKALVVDLRNNGGGLVDESIKIADFFTEKDSTLLITTDKSGSEEIEKAKSDKKINIPVVVIINENTASASEILTGALKDNNVAKVVGTKSYGKGVIQEVLNLSDGSGIKITTNEYFTPNKTKINKVGIEPDETIKLPDTVTNSLLVEDNDDTQLQKAIEILK